jgi:small subunit ribosomal protein S4
MRNLKSDWKRSRRLGFSILENGKELKKRPYAPGQHGQDKKKVSEYGKQLTEKQKLRDMYGVNERQFRRLFIIASKSKGITGVEFMRILESRLDNLVYRLGFANTRKAARQLVNHGHILVNGKKIDIPSYTCSVSDVISVKDNAKSMIVIKNSLEAITITAPYVTLDKANMKGTYDRLPERNELSQEINESLIVEYYNRLL